MKLRVILGKELVRQFAGRDNLKDICRAPDFLVQGDAAVLPIKQKGQFQAAVMGRVIGRRGKKWEVSRAKTTDLEFQKFVCSNPTEKCMQDLEGRYGLVKIDKENSLEICSDSYAQMDL
ncbi:MAG: hypothetical protein ABIA67_02650, partial [Candidatus Margulisiibacteriota bacterium]